MFGSTLRRRTRLDVNCIASCNFIITDPHAKPDQDLCTKALTNDFIIGSGQRLSIRFSKTISKMLIYDKFAKNCEIFRMI